MYQRKYTPEAITELQENEVFVFGSNEGGLHAGGAANVAYHKFGACWGEGKGHHYIRKINGIPKVKAIYGNLCYDNINS